MDAINTLCRRISTSVKTFIALTFVSLLFCTTAYAQAELTEEQLDSLISSLTTLQEDTQKVNVLNTITRELYYQARINEIQKFLDQSNQLAQKLNYQKGLFFNYRYNGSYNRAIGKFKDVIENYYKALQIAEKLGQPQLLLEIYAVMSGYYQQIGSLDNALDYTFKGLKLAESLQDQSILAGLYEGLALIYAIQENYAKAMESELKSLSLWDSTEVLYISGAYNNLADFYVRQQSSHPDSIKKALDYVEKSLELADQPEFRASYATTLITKGEVYMLKKEYDEAFRILEESLQVNQTTDLFYNIPYIYNKLAEVRLAQNNLSEAEVYYQKAFDTTVGEIEVQLDTYKGLAKLYSLKNDYKKALKYERMYHAQKDSTFNATSRERGEVLTLSYNLEKKNAKIALLEKDNILEEAKNQRSTILLILAFILIITILIIFTYQRRLGQKQKQANKALQEKNEEIAQQAEELHQQTEELATQRDSLETSYQNIELLSDIGKAIISTNKVEDIIEITYEKVNALMDASVFMIGIYHPEDKSIKIPKVIEKGKTYPPLTYHLNETERPAILCFSQEKDIIMNDVAKDYPTYFDGKQLPPVKSGDVTHSIIYLPLQNKDKTIGVISVQSFQKNAYSGYQINMLRNLAIYSAIAVENAEVIEHIEHEKHTLEGLNKELEALTEELRQQTDTVAAQRDKLAENSAQLEELLEESQSQKETLELRNDEMKSLQTTKDLMISAVNHDLRNPLNPILNYSNPSYPEPDKDKRLQMIHERAKMMFSLINDIMDVYRADKLTLHPQTADLNRAVTEAIQAISEGKHQLPVIHNEIPENTQALFEYKYIERVFENLLSNAVKYTEDSTEGGRIRFYQEIIDKDADKYLNVAIEDNGVGIPKDKFEEIFKPFSNPDARDIGAAKSVGIGLTFCKTIVEAHGSQLEIASEVGKGTTFSFILPMVAEDTSSTSIQDTSGALEDIQLTDAEKVTLANAIEELSQYELYEMELQDALDSIDPEGNQRLETWKLALQHAKDEDDEERFKALLT